MNRWAREGKSSTINDSTDEHHDEDAEKRAQLQNYREKSDGVKRDKIHEWRGDTIALLQLLIMH